jgi:hypothetical protein
MIKIKMIKLNLNRNSRNKRKKLYREIFQG